MVTNFSRKFNCKDEELPVICNFSVFNLNRDLADFTAYSSKFNQDYETGFEEKITVVADLIEPKSETVEKKIITDRLHTTMDELISPINYLKGYVEMAEGTLRISVEDFGLTPLRNGIRAIDTENVLKNLHTVITNINNHKEPLIAQGLTEPLIAIFATAKKTIAADKQAQYEMTNNRKAIVQNNLGLLNDLYDQLSEILKIGKILYQKTNPAKHKDYTFTELMKQVRRTIKKSDANSKPDTTEDLTFEAE